MLVLVLAAAAAAVAAGLKRRARSTGHHHHAEINPARTASMQHGQGLFGLPLASATPKSGHSGDTSSKTHSTQMFATQVALARSSDDLEARGAFESLCEDVAMNADTSMAVQPALPPGSGCAADAADADAERYLKLLKAKMKRELPPTDAALKLMASSLGLIYQRGTSRSTSSVLKQLRASQAGHRPMAARDVTNIETFVVVVDDYPALTAMLEWVEATFLVVGIADHTGAGSPPSAGFRGVELSVVAKDSSVVVEIQLHLLKHAPAADVRGGRSEAPGKCVLRPGVHAAITTATAAATKAGTATATQAPAPVDSRVRPVSQLVFGWGDDHDDHDSHDSHDSEEEAGGYLRVDAADSDARDAENVLAAFEQEVDC